MKNERFFVNAREYGRGKVFIIAEIGTSHGGDAAKAFELVDAAREAGADCVKFQIVKAREILHPNTGEVALPGGKVRLYDRFRELEKDIAFFAALKEKAEKNGLVFLCTAFGIESARELKSLKPQCLKIASPELNYTALLKEVASYNLPILLSSGVSKLGDIEQALSILGGNPDAPVCLLHCVTSYPAPEKDYNIRVLKNLSAIFGIPAGISDHSLDPCLVPVLGTAFGAAVIEKHFCLSRGDSGLDDPIALEPPSFADMVKAVRRAEKESPEETVDVTRKEYGAGLVESVLGDGVKRLAPSELENYERTNRSLHALADIDEGQEITKDMIASLRTEKNLRVGLHPLWEEKIIGRKAKNFIQAGEGIRFEDI